MPKVSLNFELVKLYGVVAGPQALFYIQVNLQGWLGEVNMHER
jgi:hypothetical protein